MTKITKEYANTNNGGQERITRDGDSYYINSNIHSVGWMGQRKGMTHWLVFMKPNASVSGAEPQAERPTRRES